ncbi:MAG: hypothetical protein WA977_01075 [Halobacteriota archaeon]
MTGALVLQVTTNRARFETGKYTQVRLIIVESAKGKSGVEM